jgi:heavy metal translocating P-type ATPase
MTRIIKLVTEAQEARPKLQRWFDRLSRTYALSIISLAAFFAFSLHFVLQIPFFGIEGSLYRSLAFLIAASPCALILALPIAYLSAISACARRGILLKGGVTLDALAACSVIAFDKTGTITTGNLTCTSIKPIQPPERPLTEKELLAAAYALEKNATHPIAKAVLQLAVDKQAVLDLKVDQFLSLPGYGVKAFLTLPSGEAASIYMGHPDYLEPSESLQVQLKEYQKGNQLLSILKIDNDIYILSFEDQPRSGVKETISRLKKLGRWKLLMLTGDHENSARRIAHLVGIDQFYANLRPENKLNYVTLLSEEEGLAMVGDGINDAPALARASVGICMGKVGSDTAIDASDVVLLQDNFEQLDWLLLKGEQTKKIVRQNLIIAAGAILFASLPALAGYIPLWLAVVMHEGGTVLVGLNALRLLR